MKKTIRILSLILSLLALVLCFGACSTPIEESTTTLPKDRYAFRAPNGLVVSIGAAHDNVIPQLGNYQSVNISDACGGISGKDRIYYYDGFRVYTTPSVQGEVVNMIELTSDAVKTPEGLTIGSSKADVTKTMGAGTAVGDNLSYAKGGMKLVFIFRNDTVTNIQYMGE